MMNNNYMERKPDKTKKTKNSAKVNEVIDAYTDDDNSLRFDPLGMYTGRPLDAATYNALNNGYKIYMRLDDNNFRPEQDADDL